MKKWVGLLLTAALASCSGESNTTPANQLAHNDFEQIDGWLGDASTASLTKEKAHSGVYSVSVRPGQDYSLGYSNVLGKMSASRPEKIKLNGWVFVPSAQAGAKLVVEVTDPTRPTDNTLLWQGIELNKKAKKFNEWQEIEEIIPLPATAKATSRFKLYLWRADSAQPVYLDDIALNLDNDAK